MCQAHNSLRFSHNGNVSFREFAFVRRHEKLTLQMFCHVAFGSCSWALTAVGLTVEDDEQKKSFQSQSRKYVA